MSRGPNADNLRLLALCGTRPVRRLALLVASIGPVPTLPELLSMIEGRERMIAAWERWRVAQGLPPKPTQDELKARRDRQMQKDRERRARLRAERRAA